MGARRTSDKEGMEPFDLYRSLLDRFGELGWWPAETPFEVMLGAILTQRTAWGNVERALENLRRAGVVDPETLLSLPQEELEVLCRPSGTFRQKARRLRALFAWVEVAHGGSLEAFLALPLPVLRGELLAVEGIGPETADSIALYAADRPTFVVDAYTRRILGRLGVDVSGPYEEVAEWFTKGLPADPSIYGNFHAMLVELAKTYCQRDPSCAGCPLASLCPSASV